VGVLDITDNYWAQISDPALSASWLTVHTESQRCTVGGRTWSYIYNSCGRPRGNSASCGPYACTGTRGSNGWTCWLDVEAEWDSPVHFEGFYPEPVEAGPRLDEDNPDQQRVIQERQAQGI
jgi:hypothetical protein